MKSKSSTKATSVRAKSQGRASVKPAKPKPAAALAPKPAVLSYKGRITTAGTSEAIRLDKALFKQHPEFGQHCEVQAFVIGPGKILISVQSEASESEYDPVVDAFLSFLEANIQSNPGAITPIDPQTIERARAATAGVTVTDKDFE